MTKGAHLTTAAGETLASNYEDINAILKSDGIRAWPTDLTNVPQPILALLAKPNLQEPEVEEVERHFRLSRERLLEIIAAAERKPNAPNGGALDTFCIETQIHYPRLHVISNQIDYSGFFAFHVNVGDDGVGTDEVGYVLSGEDMRYRFLLRDGRVVVLSLSCPSDEQAWLFTFDGGAPHGGILDNTKVGTKVLVHAIGPARFHMRAAE